MTGPGLDRELIASAVASPRWNVLARTGLDIATIGTWDPALVRRRRICVPVDVQAYVVPVAGAEQVVSLYGDARDPEPFSDGAALPAGVHLHWAMPDGLMHGEPTTRDAQGRSERLAMPALPDRWVVLRLLRPRGGEHALVRGWVIDAKSRSTAPLESFSGTFPPHDPADVLERLDGGHGGSLMWTGSYRASAGRFAFHDPLQDVPPAVSIAPNGLHDTSAAYVVSGWWSDLAGDPLAANDGWQSLMTRLAALGWTLDDDALPPLSSNTRQARDVVNASIGLTMPKDGPTVEVVPEAGASLSQKLSGIAAGVAMPVLDATQVLMAIDRPKFATVLHGAVFGVPVAGQVTGADERPTPHEVSVALGQDTDDVIAAFGASVLGVANRDAAERLIAAFTSDLLDRIATADGVVDLAEHEHADGFDSRVGTPLPGAIPDRFTQSDTASVNPLSIGRKGRGEAAKGKSSAGLNTKLVWANTVELTARSAASTLERGPQVPTIFKAAVGMPAARTGERPGDAPAHPNVSSVREVVRPAPRYFFPQPPILALRGVKPNLRHHGDGRFEDGNALRCRYAEECVTELSGAVRASDLLPSLGSGALPEEVLLLAREAVLLDPYGLSWINDVVTAGQSADYAKAIGTRLLGEMARLYGTNASYGGQSHITGAVPSAAPALKNSWIAHSAAAIRIDREVAAQLAAHSIVKGTPPSPVAITTWRQPWVPLWVEWRVVLEGGATLDGWRLGDLDHERVETPLPTIRRTFLGRSPLGSGTSKALHAGIRRWLEAETQRDTAGVGVLNATDQTALGLLGNFLAPLDLMSASMDGIREQLLGIAYVGQMPLDEAAPPLQRPVASGLPDPFFGGTLRLDALRIVDAFGRTLDVGVSSIATTVALEVPAAPSSILLRPRAQHAARWVVRFVGTADPAAPDPSARPDANVDQVAPASMVNPVAGFLLPDHIDESLEVFATDGSPIGELAHDAITGAVTWEPAPGRPIAPDAGPFAGLSASQSPIAEVAAGVLLADVAARQLVGGGTVDAQPTTSLSAMLRALDTTLWSVDTYAAIGSPSIAGLVGRPIAVVRASIRLELPDDTGDVTVKAAGGAGMRRSVFAALSELRVPFRLGALERADDALLGFYVGDDFAHLHLVDKVVQGTAPPSGRMQGALGLLGSSIDLTATPIDHPYIIAEDELWVRPGQELFVTLLMLPAGRVHLTSGLLPRKALSLAEDWVSPGLKTMSPSVRVGPVLVDPAEIRLPLIRAMGPRQRFTRRTGPLTWRDDAIKAATMSAYLPRVPHEAQEGWIRVQPDEDPPVNGEAT
jgi:hypothetical protein